MVLPFLKFPDGARCVIKWDSEAGIWTNTLWFSKTDFDLSDLTDLADHLVAFSWTNYASLLNDSVALTQVQAYDMRSIDGPVATHVYENRHGSNAGDILPLQDALVVTLRTSHRGRAYRGRVYQAGICETFQDGGVFIGNALTYGLELVNGCHAQAALYGWTPCVPSRQLDHVLRSEGVLTPVSDVEIRSPIPGSQRRRSRRP